MNMNSSKVSKALQLIQVAFNQFGDSLYVGHSGGKDSAVIYTLTKMVNPDVLVVHNAKPSTHPDTIAYLYELCYNQQVHFVPSSETERFIKEKGLKCQVDGTRIAEFNRTDKSAVFIRNGVDVSRTEMTEFEENGIFGLSLLYPIYDWTDEEVFSFICANNIPLSKEYGNVCGR